MVYWHVDDVKASVERLVAMGATVHEALVERGPGFVTASVTDPFGNILGVMLNQHYLEILASRAGLAARAGSSGRAERAGYCGRGAPAHSSRRPGNATKQR